MVDFPRIYSANKITYSIPKSLNVAKQSSLQEYAANSSTYNSTDNITVYTPTGEQFVDFSKSYLRMTITLSSTVVSGPLSSSSVTWGHGSAFGMFDSIQMSNSSGDKMFRHEYVGDRLVAEHRTLYTNDFKSKVGSIYMDGSLATDLSPAAWASQATGLSATTAKYVLCFPLYLFGGLLAQKQLAPPQLIANAKWEFQLNTMIKMFKDVITTGSGATRTLTMAVSDVAMKLHCVELNDKAMGLVKRISASTEGLQMSFTDVYASATDDGAVATRVNVSTNYSVGRAYGAMVLLKSLANETDAAVDSFLSDTNVPTSIFWKSGALQPYSQPINYTATGATNPEIFYTSLIGQNRHTPFESNGCGVALADTDKQSYVINLKSNDGIAGIPLSSQSQLLNCQITTASVQRRIILYLYYFKVLKIFTSKVKVFE